MIITYFSTEGTALEMLDIHTICYKMSNRT